MKYFYRFFFIVATFAAITTTCHLSSCNTPEINRESNFDTIVVKSKELIPEGIAVHPETGVIYLSSLNQDKIVILDSVGNCKDLISQGQDGFMKGLGIKISRDGKTLWACSASLDTVHSTSGLFQIDLASGRVLHSFLYKDDSSSLFNDLAIHSNGQIYLTDSYQRTVFRYDPLSRKIESWLTSDQLTFANGIAFSGDEKVLFVASGDKGVQRIDMPTKEIKTVTTGERTDYAIDGLIYHDKTLIGVIGWPHEDAQNHRVIRYRLSDDLYMKSADTLMINKSYIHVATTADLQNGYLYILGKTNLELYNRGGQSLEKVKDSLAFPLVVKMRL